MSLKTDVAPEGSGVGNTIIPRTRIFASKKWCFTAYIEPNEMIELIGSNGSYFFGVELCPTTGRQHLQGFITFKEKCRPCEKIKNKNIHWEKQKGSDEDNHKYCSKDGKVFTNIEKYKPVKTLEENQLYDWEREVIKIIKQDPDDRKIYWFWEPDGNKGKTTFCKYLSIKYKAIPLEGKKNDILFCAASFPSNLYVWDLERSMEDYISYGAIEKIKNGYYMCSKYESKPIIRDCPHVLIFANFKPDKKALSEDRWVIKNLSKD